MASSSRSRKCKNKANAFCYICGVYAFPRQVHNGNKYGTVSIGHSTVLKERQDDIRTVMDLLKYHQHG